jgi:transposase
LRVVENYRNERGKKSQRVIANLGRLEDLRKGKLDELVGKLRKFCRKHWVVAEEVEDDEAIRWGPILVARRLWEEMELDGIIQGLCAGRKGNGDVAERAFVLVANRLTEPGSEHGLAWWLESHWVCDSRGRRFVPEWRSVEEVTEERRVKVEWRQLERWYRTLDALYAQKKELERELYLRLRDLLSLKVDMVFYDVTSLSFAGRRDKGELKRHGYPRGGSPRNVQVLLGLVMVGGFPIAGHVFRGNVADKTTVQEVISDIEHRFGIQEVTFVADQGMVSPQNLLSLVPHRYLLAHKGRRDSEARRWLERLTERWREYSQGVRVQEVQSGQEGVRVFVVDSDERREYEESLRKRSMQRAEECLKKVAQAVQKGRLKSKEKIAVWAERALRKNKGYRYFSYRIPSEGEFDYFLDEEKMRAETLREGRYILTTNHAFLSPEEGVSHYKDLSDIEAGFRELKDVIQGRPIYHQRDDRICAHIFIAQLALLLLRRLRHHLREKRVPLSPSDAIAAVKSIGVAELDLKGRKELLVSRPKPHARQVLTALGITDLKPPGSTRHNKRAAAR